MISPRNFEVAEGWASGNPKVLYKPEVADRLGEPKVDYDALGQFFTDELQVPRDFAVNILLYGTRGAVHDFFYPRVLGSHSFFRPHNVWVNALKAEEYEDPRLQTMGIVAHEGRHLSDRVNSPLRMFAEIGLGSKEKYEQRARAQQKHESLIRHQSDISFPHSKLRTAPRVAL